MKRVIGIGGIFFKSSDPDRLRAWYQKHLGMKPDPYGSVVFDRREREEPEKARQTVWSLFPRDTKYFDPSSAPFMINYRMENLDSLLEQLRIEGVQVDDRIEEYELRAIRLDYGSEGNRIELWEPGVPFTKEAGED